MKRLLRCTLGAVREAQARQRAASIYDRAFFVAMLLSVPVLALAQTGNGENGKKLFTKHDCYWCHGTAGQGGSAGARIGGTALTLQGVMRYVRQPAGAMPAFTDKVLTDQELTDIYAYLKSVQAPKTTAVPLLDQLAREKDK